MSQPPLVVFRADASPRIGTGHVMRCLTLANRLSEEGAECLFVARVLAQGLAERLARTGHRLLILPPGDPSENGTACPSAPYARWLDTTTSRDARDTVASLKAIRRPAAVVVDHYALDQAWEAHVGRTLEAPIVAIDDLTRAHDCRLLLDTTFGRQASDYDERVPGECVRLVGSSYALLRPDFAAAREDALSRRDRAFASAIPARDILVSMGGADVDDATGWVVDGLEPLARERGLRLHALVGSAYPHGPALEARVERLSGHAILHRDVDAMAALLSRMDLAIGAAGSSAWERCCLGLPTVQLVLADNQRFIARALDQRGAAVDGGAFDPAGDAREWVRRHVVRALEPSEMAASSLCARDVADGAGARHVAAAVLAPVVRDGPFELRHARMDDAERLFQWQLDPRTRRYAVTKVVPGWEEHVAFLTRKLADERSSFYVATAGGIACGVVRLDASSAPEPPVRPGAPWREVSIHTAPQFHGCGVASRALKELARRHGDEALVAHVLPGNRVSETLFVRAGYVPYAPGFLLGGNRPLETGNED